MEQGLVIGEMQGGGRGLEGGLWMAAGGEGSVVAWGFLGRGHPSQTRAGGVTWCPTEGLAKCGYKKAFVNVRSLLMGRDCASSCLCSAGSNGAALERSACPTCPGNGAIRYGESRGGAGSTGWGLGTLFLP